MNEIRLVLPPEGSFLRDYVLLSYSIILGYAHISYAAESTLTGDYLIIRNIEPRDLCMCIDSYFRKVKEIVRQRKITFLKVHKNDRETIGKAIKKKYSKETTYLEIFGDILEYALGNLDPSSDQCMYFIRELGQHRLSKTNNIILGDTKLSGEIAPLQPFKLEKYKYGKAFLKFGPDIKGDIRMSLNYSSIPIAGWLLSYMGYYGKLIHALPPDEQIIKTLVEPEYHNLLLQVFDLSEMDQLVEKEFGEKGYYSIAMRIFKVRRGFHPVEAYILLHAIEAGEFVKRAVSMPVRLISVSFDGKRFTLSDDIVFDPLTLGRFIIKLVSAGGPVVEAVKKLAECAIDAYNGNYSSWCEQQFGDSSNAIRMVKILYSAAVGSLEPGRAVYYLARSSPLATDKTPYFRKKAIVSSLLYALR